MAKGIWPRKRSGRKEIWIVFKDETGKKRREKIGLDTPEIRLTASEVLAKRQHEAVVYKHFPERKALDTTFREAAQKYWDLVLYEADSSWHFRWNELVGVFGDMRLVDVKADKIQPWYNKKVAKSKVGAGNANRTLSLLRSIFNGAVRWDLYSLANPVGKVITKPDPPALTRFLSKAEMEHFFTVCSSDLLPIVVFALLTGLRKSEALYFDWEDVDLSRLEIKADRLKGGKYPEIPVADKLRRLFIFLGPRPKGRLFEMSEMTLRRRFDAAREASGLNHFTWRDFRRTFGSHFAMATMDLPVLSRLFGHGSMHLVNTTYVHLLDGHVRAKMSIFDAAMPELPAALRQLDTPQIGHHPGHQAPGDAAPGVAESDVKLTTFGQLAQR